MSRVTLARALLVISIIFAIALYTVGALIKPGYSPISNFISELNATGTPWATAISFGGFLPLGLLLAAFLIAAGPVVEVRGLSRIGFWLQWSHPVAFLGAVVAPCDPRCPDDGSLAQRIHNINGVITYFAAGLGISLLSVAPGRGLLQRLADLILAAVLIIVAWRMIPNPSHRED